MRRVARTIALVLVLAATAAGCASASSYEAARPYDPVRLSRQADFLLCEHGPAFMPLGD